METIEREPITKDMVKALIMSISPIQRMVLNLAPEAIDLEFGRGIFGPKSHCIWDKKGYKFSIDVLSDGGLCVARGKQPDAFYLGTKKQEKEPTQ